jgi:hypothetical protein
MFVGRDVMDKASGLSTHIFLSTVYITVLHTVVDKTLLHTYRRHDGKQFGFHIG